MGECVTTASKIDLRRFTKSPILIGLALVYAFVWVWFAVDPVWRPQWWLDNILVFIFLGGLLATYRKFPLSEGSYLCTTIFMMFHAVGANMGYSNVPLGAWVTQAFGFARPNVYDRLVHFLFGFLLSMKCFLDTRICVLAGSISCRWMLFCRTAPRTNTSKRQRP